MKIVDFHIHPFLSSQENACLYKDVLPISPDEAMNDLKNLGITMACGSVIRHDDYFTEGSFEKVKSCNETALEIHRQSGSFYYPGFHIHPAYVRESMETIEFMHENGFRLIGELVPAIQNWDAYGLDYGSKELNTILEVANDYSMIVSFHTMYRQQKQMEQMIADHPNITFVAAHPGEWESYQEHLNRIRKYSNAYLDLSGTGLFRYGMLRYGVQKAGAEKFLFGTDYPIVNPGMYLQAVYTEKITQKEKEMILGENAMRLLNETS